MKYETWAPLFPGFYNTIFNYSNEDEDIRYYNEENKTSLEYDDFEWDWKDYEERVSKAFCERLEKELKQLLPIKIKYQSISSPKEYNFKNDSINIEVRVSLTRIYKLIKNNYEQARAYFQGEYTGYDGFIPFHSDDVDDWLKKEYILENPAHRIGALLECLITLDGTFDQLDLYEWCQDETSYISFTPKEKEEA